jgi:hypothetical protein
MVMKSNFAALFLIVAAVVLLATDRRLDLLALIVPLSIAGAIFVLQRPKNASVEYKRKR